MQPYDLNPDTVHRVYYTDQVTSVMRGIEEDTMRWEYRYDTRRQLITRLASIAPDMGGVPETESTSLCPLR